MQGLRTAGGGELGGDLGGDELDGDLGGGRSDMFEW